LYYSKEEALSKISLSKQEGYVLPPGMLDSALQTCLGLKFGEDGSVLSMPYSVKVVNIYGALDKVYWCYARKSTAEHINRKAVSYDIDLLSETGEVLLRFKDFLPLPLNAFQQGASTNHDTTNAEKSGYSVTFCAENKTLLAYSSSSKGYDLLERIHAAIAAFCRSDFNVIYDAVIFDEPALKGAAKQFSRHEVFFVGVYCSEEEREARELKRGDRALGMHKINAEFIYNSCEYDIKVDTTSQSPADAATEIVKMLDLVTPKVFKNIIEETVCKK